LSEVRPASQWTEEAIMTCAVGLDETRTASASVDAQPRSGKGTE
jgi:hypothetical protein